MHYPAREKPPATVADFDPESLPETIEFIPVSQGLEFRLDPDHRFDSHRRMGAGEGDRFSIHGEVTSPFDYYLNMFGFSEGFIGLLEHPARAREILDRLTPASRS